MLVPLDMNGQKTLNYDLKFGNLFKIIKCYIKPLPQQNLAVLTKKSDNQTVSFSIPIVLHSITLFNNQKFNNNTYIHINSGGIGHDRRIHLDNPSSQSNYNNTCADLSMLYIFNTGIRYIRFFNTGNLQFDVDIVIAYM